MRPVGNVVLDDAGDTGRSRGVLELMGLGKIKDGAVRVGDRFLQEQERVGNAWLGFALEGFGQRLRGDLRRDLAVEMPAHPVGNDHE